jgi:hydrogenase maturation factor
VLAAAEGALGLALVRTATGEEEIDTTLVGAVVPGDLLLVHAGAALTLLTAEAGAAR